MAFIFYIYFTHKPSYRYHSCNTYSNLIALANKKRLLEEKEWEKQGKLQKESWAMEDEKIKLAQAQKEKEEQEHLRQLIEDIARVVVKDEIEKSNNETK